MSYHVATGDTTSNLFRLAITRNTGLQYSICLITSQLYYIAEERTATAIGFGPDRHTDQGKETPNTTNQHGMCCTLQEIHSMDLDSTH